MHGCFSLAYSVLTLRTFVVGLEQVEGECIDGEELKLKVPSAAVINEIVTANHKQETSKLGAQSPLCFGIFLESNCMGGRKCRIVVRYSEL